MAKKRSIEENPPAPASEEKEEEEANDSEEESTNDEDQQGKAPLASQGRKALLFPAIDSYSDSESESSSEPSSPSASAFQLKPITPNRTKKPTQTASMNAESATAAAKKKSAAIVEEEEEEGEEGRKGGQWRSSEGDEITLLNGMIQYKFEKGSDASSDWGAFLDYIQKSLQNQVSKSALATKVRRLKQKYQNLAEKCKSSKGGDPLFSKPHEKKSFELSKEIWGSDGGESEKKKSSSKVGNIGSSGGLTLALAKPEFTSSLAPIAKKPKRVSNREMSGDTNKEKNKGGSSRNIENEEVKRGVPKVEEMEKEKEKEKNLGNEEVKRVFPKVEEMENELSQKYPCLFASMKGKSVEEKISKVFMNEVGKIDEAKLKEWESRWVKLQRSELQLFVQQKLLITEQVKEVLDILKS